MNKSVQGSKKYIDLLVAKDAKPRKVKRAVERYNKRIEVANSRRNSK